MYCELNKVYCGTALQARNSYDSKSGQTVSRFVGQILISEALSQILMGWQGRYLLIKNNFIFSPISGNADVTDVSAWEHRTLVLIRLDCMKLDTLSILPKLCCGILTCLLSCIGQLFVQIKTVIINMHVLLLLACLINSGGSGIWNLLCKCVESAGTYMSWGKQRNDSSS